MRVVLACDFFLRYSAMLAAGLDRAGAEVALVRRDHDLEFGGARGAAEEFVAAAVGEGEVRSWRTTGRVRSPRGLAAAARLRRQVAGFAPQVVHLQESVGNDPRLLYVAGVRRRRYALTVHDPVRHPGDQDVGWVARMNRALVAGAGLIFVHGEALREEVEAQAAPRAPIVVVPHGIETARPTSVPPGPSILFFGRISHYKGLDVLLDAMSAVWRSVPDATLTVAGAGAIEPHEVLRDDRVTVRSGHLPDAEVPALFEAARCVVLPYRQASQSGVGSLAKAYGRPLLVTEVGALPELVADGSGLTVPAEDPTALAASLVRLLRDDEIAADLGRHGEAAAAATSWEEVGEATLAAYREHLLAPVSA